MSFTPLIKNGCLRRCIGVVLFVFVFTLPFHFHRPSDISQITQECSCYLSGRTQLGPTPAPVVLAPGYEAIVLPPSGAEAPASVAVHPELARSPPVAV